MTPREFAERFYKIHRRNVISDRALKLTITNKQFPTWEKLNQKDRDLLEISFTELLMEIMEESSE